MSFKDSNTDQFILDDRSIEWHLENISAYCKIIPFIDGEQTGNWQDILQAKGIPLSQLAALYQDLSLVNGLLAPQQAFLLAFMQLLETPRRLLNDLPARHRQFYYRELLRLQELPAQPDRTLVAVNIADKGKEQWLAQGTELDGGQTLEGSALIYRTESGLLANHGQLAHCYDYWPAVAEQASWLRTLYLEDQIDWPEAGARLLTYDTQRSATVQTGRAVASAVLQAASGLRIITVTFNAPLLNREGLVAEVSGEGHWLPLQITGEKTQLVLALAEDQPAIVAPTGLAGYQDPMPVLRIRSTLGEPLPTLLSVTMAISGATNIMMSTDDSPASPQSTVYPFGSDPLIKRGFNLIAPEWGNGQFAVTLTLEPQWLNLPDVPFTQWYTNYSGKPGSNGDFKVEAQLAHWQGDEPILLEAPQQSLFGGAKAPEGEALTLVLPVFQVVERQDDNPTYWRHWLRFELAGQDFLHNEYRHLIAEKPGINAPYTPQISGLSVRSECTDNQLTQQYVLTPLGYCETQDEEQERPQILLGIRDIQPGQMLSLYWRLWGGNPIHIQWQYLAQGNQWKSLDFAVNDGTNGLFSADIWQAVLPQDSANEQPWMPAGMHWLRAVLPASAGATAPNDVSGYPWLQKIITNALWARLANSESVDASHFIGRLPAYRLKYLQSPQEGIVGVEQPWPSEDGRPAESNPQFSQRVAQRLRHRQRALTRKDVGDLLTQQFPEIYDVCWIAREERAGQSACVVVIPVNGRQDNDNTQQPVFSPARLQRMADYIAQHASPWSRLSVSNPRYVEVQVTCQAIFNQGVTLDYGYQQLWQAIERHYMPWVSDNISSVRPGEQLDYYKLLAFIQQQPWVERVTELRLERLTDTPKTATTLSSHYEPIHLSTNEVYVLSFSNEIALARRSHVDII